MPSLVFLLEFFFAFSNGIDIPGPCRSLLEPASRNDSKKTSANQWQHDQSQPFRQLAELLLSLAITDGSGASSPRIHTMNRQICNIRLAADGSVDLNALTVPVLKDKLRFLGLRVSGKKAELVARLSQHIGEVNDLPSNARSSDLRSYESAEEAQSAASQRRHQPSPPPTRGGGSKGGGREVVLEKRKAREVEQTPDKSFLDQGARFDQLPISSATKKAISEGFGYEFMTEVQAQTVGPILEGHDVLARAKTGTGKTLGFLIPSIELVCKQPSQDYIQALIISPARELAQQIFTEAEVLLSTHKELSAMCVFGGRPIKRDQKQFERSSCNLLVATPGRLQDHIANTPGFAKRLSRLQFFILDEADQLLEMGFRKNIIDIVKYLPPATARQSLLFSATFPTQIEDIANLVLKPGYRMINTVKPEDESTPDQIKQFYAVAPIEEVTLHLWDGLRNAMDENPDNFKIVVFFTTARLVGYYAELFRHTNLRPQIFEIHSRLSQSRRTKESDRFRSASRGILFSSDVSARGLDYPGVTKVIQVGAPSSTDQYIHRLGRTGRAGSSGSGLLILQDFETYFLRALGDLPLEKMDSSVATNTQPVPEAFSEAISAKSMALAYSAWLGYYTGKLKDLKMSAKDVVKEANRFAASMHAIDNEGRPPPILKKTVGKMGLKNVPGLNLVGAYPWK